MTHIKITKSGSKPARLEVDGVDWSGKVYAEGFKIDVPEDFAQPATVTVVMPVDELEIDLPDAKLRKLRRERATLS